MYVRPPNNTTERLKVPENYRGNAFGASGEYTDMPSPVRLPRTEYDLPPEEYRESNQSRVPHDDNALNEEKALSSPPIKKTNFPQTSQIAQNSPTDNSMLSSLLHQTSNTAHFPFGHGIGGEELLILGIMLLVFTHGSESGEYDNTLILLLALILFSG